MKQSKINRGLGLFGLALLVIPEDGIAGTELRITTRRAFRNNDVAHWGWSLFAFVAYATILSVCLLVPGYLNTFDDVTLPDLAQSSWYCFMWVMWLVMQRD